MGVGLYENLTMMITLLSFTFTIYLNINVTGHVRTRTEKCNAT